MTQDYLSVYLPSAPVLILINIAGLLVIDVYYSILIIENYAWKINMSFIGTLKWIWIHYGLWGWLFEAYSNDVPQL